MRIIRKVFEVGFVNFIIGCVKRIKYITLLKKYNFDRWHISPYEHRKYAIEVGKYISQYRPQLVVDIGCGLGDLLRHIKLSEKGQGFGYDLSENAIRAAKRLSRSEKLNFQTGSFDSIVFKQTIDYLIALNFMYGSPEEKWKQQFEILLERNKVHYIVVDILPRIEERDQYCLDFRLILPANFERIQRMELFKGERNIEIWENRDMER